GRRAAQADAEELRTVLRVEIGEEGGVTARNDEHVARRHRAVVEERDRPLVLEQNAGRRMTGNDVTEHAGHDSSPGRAPRSSGRCATSTRCRRAGLARGTWVEDPSRPEGCKRRAAP